MHRTLVIAVLLAVPAAAQNLVVNGDFERTKVTGCSFNLLNTNFDSVMPSCTGFGGVQGQGEIDVMVGGDCGYGLPAPSGATKLGISSQGDGSGSDAFSIRLTAPLVPGQLYRLAFEANAYVSSFSPQIGAVEVGLAEGPVEFGIKVGELVPSAVAWSTFHALITALAPGRYLTVRYKDTSHGWDHVDNFRLVPAGATGVALDTVGSTIRVDGATPDKLVALLVSPASHLHPASLAAVLVADGTGSASCDAGLLLGPALCIQALDLATGGLSPVVAPDACSPNATQEPDSAAPPTSGPAVLATGTSLASPPAQLAGS